MEISLYLSAYVWCWLIWSFLELWFAGLNKKRGKKWETTWWDRWILVWNWFSTIGNKNVEVEMGREQIRPWSVLDNRPLNFFRKISNFGIIYMCDAWPENRLKLEFGGVRISWYWLDCKYWIDNFLDHARIVWFVNPNRNDLRNQS